LLSVKVFIIYISQFISVLSFVFQIKYSFYQTQIGFCRKQPNDIVLHAICVIVLIYEAQFNHTEIKLQPQYDKLSLDKWLKLMKPFYNELLQNEYNFNNQFILSQQHLVSSISFFKDELNTDSEDLQDIENCDIFANEYSFLYYRNIS